MAFNLEEFIAGRNLPRQPIGYYEVDNRRKIAGLRQRLTAEQGDQRESSVGSDVQQQIEALEAEQEASRIEFVIRMMTPDEFRAYVEDDKQGLEDGLAIMSRAPEGHDPAKYTDLTGMSAAEWKRLGEHIGARQFGVLGAQANDFLTSKAAVPDFSRTVSESLKPRTSSES